MSIRPLSVVLCLSASLWMAAPPASADEGDETLRSFLAKADLVIAGELVSDSSGLVEEAGRINYLFDLRPLEVFKGRRPEGASLRVNVIRHEGQAKDRLPYLKKGSSVILFLVPSGPSDPKGPPNANPPWKTVNPWFGVQPYSRAMAPRLSALARD